MLAAAAQVDSQLRELTLMVVGEASGQGQPIPAELERTMQTLADTFAEVRHELKRLASEAAAAGMERTRVRLTLSEAAAAQAQEYLTALDEIDAHARSGTLLTLETPLHQRVFHRWYVHNAVAQVSALQHQETPPPAHAVRAGRRRAGARARQLDHPACRQPADRAPHPGRPTTPRSRGATEDPGATCEARARGRSALQVRAGRGSGAVVLLAVRGLARAGLGGLVRVGPTSVPAVSAASAPAVSVPEVSTPGRSDSPAGSATFSASPVASALLPAVGAAAAGRWLEARDVLDDVLDVVLEVDALRGVPVAVAHGSSVGWLARHAA